MNATPIKILIVDDEPPIRRLLRVGLATQGYTAIEAANGRAAIEHMQGCAHRPRSSSISACPSQFGWSS